MVDQSKQIQATIQTVEGLTDNIVRYTGERIDQTTEALDSDIYALESIVKLRIAKVEITLVVGYLLFTRMLTYTLSRLTFLPHPH